MVREQYFWLADTTFLLLFTMMIFGTENELFCCLFVCLQPVDTYVLQTTSKRLNLQKYRWGVALTISTLRKIFPMIVKYIIGSNTKLVVLACLCVLMLPTQNACSTLMFPSQFHCL